MTAHQDAAGIVADVLATLDPAQPYTTQAAAVLDAISGGLHAELALEDGALTHVGWLRSDEHHGTIHRLERTDRDAQRRGERPVYVLTEEPDA